MLILLFKINNRCWHNFILSKKIHHIYLTVKVLNLINLKKIYVFIIYIHVALFLLCAWKSDIWLRKLVSVCPDIPVSLMWQKCESTESHVEPLLFALSSCGRKYEPYSCHCKVNISHFSTSYKLLKIAHVDFIVKSRYPSENYIT